MEVDLNEDLVDEQPEVDEEEVNGHIIEEDETEVVAEHGIVEDDEMEIEMIPVGEHGGDCEEEQANESAMEDEEAEDSDEIADSMEGNRS